MTEPPPAPLPGDTLEISTVVFEKGLLKVSIVDRWTALDVPSLVGTDEGDEGEEEGS